MRSRILAFTYTSNSIILCARAFLSLPTGFAPKFPLTLPFPFGSLYSLLVSCNSHRFPAIPASKMASKENDERVMTVEELQKTCGLLNDNDKLKVFLKKYEDLLKLYRNTEYGTNTSRRELSMLTAENNKLILARSRLESLCRELQKQNKVIKDETILRIREEEEKRKQITQEFQKTLNNVTTMMSESNTQNTKLGEENKQMAQRLSSIYEEFKTRESEVDRITKQIDLEKQLCEARCAKMKTEFMMERQALLVENEALNQKVGHLTRDLIDTSKSCSMLEQQVASLTSQIEVYTGKYQEFETTISKSGRIFDHCKSEIDKLNKQIKVLEKEVTDWQNRYKKNISTIYELQVDNAEKTKTIDNITKKQNQLTKLCRQLQAERKAYINTLRDLGQNPSDIVIDIADEDSAIEEPQPSTSGQTLHTSNDDTKFVGRGKAVAKAKRGKQKGKKGKDVPLVFGAPAPPMTLKEIQLAELKEQLDKVQKHVMQIQSLEAHCNYASELAKRESPELEDAMLNQPEALTDDKTKDTCNTQSTPIVESSVEEGGQSAEAGAEGGGLTNSEENPTGESDNMIVVEDKVVITLIEDEPDVVIEKQTVPELLED